MIKTFLDLAVMDALLVNRIIAGTIIRKSGMLLGCYKHKKTGEVKITIPSKTNHYSAACLF